MNLTFFWTSRIDLHSFSIKILSMQVDGNIPFMSAMVYPIASLCFFNTCMRLSSSWWLSLFDTMIGSVLSVPNRHISDDLAEASIQASELSRLMLAVWCLIWQIIGQTGIDVVFRIFHVAHCLPYFCFCHVSPAFFTLQINVPT